MPNRIPNAIPLERGKGILQIDIKDTNSVVAPFQDLFHQQPEVHKNIGPAWNCDTVLAILQTNSLYEIT